MSAASEGWSRALAADRGPNRRRAEAATVHLRPPVKVVVPCFTAGAGLPLEELDVGGRALNAPRGIHRVDCLTLPRRCRPSSAPACRAEPTLCPLPERRRGGTGAGG